ncbi:MAG: hypothetical protein ACP5RN_09525 [Armatimonadota bacterium]
MLRLLVDETCLGDPLRGLAVAEQSCVETVSVVYWMEATTGLPEAGKTTDAHSSLSGR